MTKQNITKQMDEPTITVAEYNKSIREINENNSNEPLIIRDEKLEILQKREILQILQNLQKSKKLPLYRVDFALNCLLHIEKARVLGVSMFEIWQKFSSNSEYLYKHIPQLKEEGYCDYVTADDSTDPSVVWLTQKGREAFRSKFSIWLEKVMLKIKEVLW